VRRPIRHRLAITLSVIIPGVLLTLAIVGLSAKYNRQSVNGIFASAGQPQQPHVDHQKLNIGVYEAAPTPNLTTVTEFGQAIGRQPNLMLIYSEWDTKFRTGVAWAALRNHMTLIDQMEPKNVSIAAIANGHWDTYLRNYANSVRKFNHPVIIGFGHEMNGTWYSWGSGHVLARTWVLAWKHIVNIFRQQQADNVTWLWTVHHAPTGLRQYWPGKDYVDWVGIDGYFEKPKNTFTSIFGVAIDAVRKFTKLPILIAETAVGPKTHKLVVDVRRLFAAAYRRHLLGLVWFDKGQHNGVRHQNWRLESHPAELVAFQQEERLFSPRHPFASAAP
jgi:mannan endo-1,4-beta-mannosidase